MTICFILISKDIFFLKKITIFMLCFLTSTSCLIMLIVLNSVKKICTNTIQYFI